MHKNKETINVTVDVRKTDGDWKIDPIADLKFNKNQSNMWRSGHYVIAFKVFNHNGGDYYFQGPDEGFWVEEANGAGPPKSGQLPYCYATSTSPDGQILYVRNDDPHTVRLKYTLNLVSDKAGQGPITLDPIMDNQNGGFAMSESRFGLVAAIATATALVAGVALVAGLLRGAIGD